MEKNGDRPRSSCRFDSYLLNLSKMLLEICCSTAVSLYIVCISLICAMLIIITISSLIRIDALRHYNELTPAEKSLEQKHSRKTHYVQKQKAKFNILIDFSEK